jgi:hypothetical protein
MPDFTRRGLRSARRRVAALAVATGATLAVGAAPAMADSSADVCRATWWPYFHCKTAAKATFSSYGEVFRVTDTWGDGRSAIVYYWVGNGPRKLCINSGGEGTTKTCDLTRNEGKQVVWHVCAVDLGGGDGGGATCSGNRYDRT